MITVGRGTKGVLFASAAACFIAVPADAQSVAVLVAVSTSTLFGLGTFSVSSTRTPSPAEFSPGDEVRPDDGSVLVVEYVPIDDQGAPRRLLFIQTGTTKGAAVEIPEPSVAAAMLQSAQVIDTPDSLRRVLGQRRKRAQATLIIASALTEPNLLRVLQTNGFELHPSFPDPRNLEFQSINAVAGGGAAPRSNAVTTQGKPAINDTTAVPVAQPQAAPGQPTKPAMLQGKWIVSLGGQLWQLTAEASKQWFAFPFGGERFDIQNLAEFNGDLVRFEVQGLPVRGTRESLFAVGRISEDGKRIGGLLRTDRLPLMLFTWSATREQ